MPVAKRMLHEFLCQWLEWASKDEPESHNEFRRDTGLCCSLDNWLDSKELERSVYHEVRQVLYSMLEKDGLCPYFPFGEDAYRRDADSRLAHKNLDRQAWVFRAIHKLKGEVF